MPDPSHPAASITRVPFRFCAQISHVAEAIRCKILLDLVGAGIVAALVFGCAYRFVLKGEMNPDEGFYAAAASAFQQGRLPYRDFGFTQTPILPALHALLLPIAGDGVQGLRLLHSVLGGLVAAITFLSWRRTRLGLCTSLLLSMVWCASPALLYYITIAKTYAFAALFLVLAASVLSASLPFQKTLLLLSLFGTCAVGCRLTTLPSVAILWCGLALRDDAKGAPLALVGTPLLFAVFLIGPFYLAAPSNAYFWTWQFHLLHHPAADNWLPFRTLWHSVAMAPGVATLALVGLLLGLRRARASAKAWTPGLWILIAGAVGWILNTLAAGIYAEYVIPFLPLVLLGCGQILGEARNHQFIGIATALLALAISPAWRRQPSTSRTDTFIEPGYLETVADAAKVVHAATPVGKGVLASVPEVVIAAGAPIVPGFEMGMFSISVELPRPVAEARHMVHFSRLYEMIQNRENSIIVLSRFYRWNFAWSTPSFVPFSPEVYRRYIIRPLLAGYDCIYANSHFLVFRARTGSSVPIALSENDLLQLYIPIEDQAPGNNNATGSCPEGTTDTSNVQTDH